MAVDQEPRSDILERKGKDRDLKQKADKPKFKDSAISGMPPPDPEEDPDKDKLKKYEKFKKKDGSCRYECEKQESPQWEKTKKFNDKINTNGLRGRYKEYYRWDN